MCLADDNNTRRKCDGVRIVSQLSKAEVLIKWKEMSWWDFDESNATSIEDKVEGIDVKNLFTFFYYFY